MATSLYVLYHADCLPINKPGMQCFLWGAAVFICQWSTRTVWAALGSLSHLLPSYRGGEEKCNIQEQMWEPSMRKGQSIMNSVLDVVSWVWYFSSNQDSNVKLFNINAVFKIFHLWRYVLPWVSWHLKILPIDSDLRAVKK